MTNDYTPGVKIHRTRGVKIQRAPTVHGFHFYNNWADILTKMKRYEQAIEKYKQAQYFFGDEAWALQNIGTILEKQGRYGEAETRYRESLSKGTIPNAVAGYLGAIYKQKDFRRFLEAYEKWGFGLPDKKRPVFAVISGIAHCELGERTEAENALKNTSSPNTDPEIESLRSYLTSCMSGNTPRGAGLAPIPGSPP